MDISNGVTRVSSRDGSGFSCLTIASDLDRRSFSVAGPNYHMRRLIDEASKMVESGSPYDSTRNRIMYMMAIVSANF